MVCPPNRLLYSQHEEEKNNPNRIHGVDAKKIAIYKI